MSRSDRYAEGVEGRGIGKGVGVPLPSPLLYLGERASGVAKTVLVQFQLERTHLMVALVSQVCGGIVPVR